MSDIALDEEVRLAAVHELQLLDSPPEERFDRITRLATQLFGVPMAMVTLVDRDRQWVKSGYGTDLKESPRDVAFCDHAIRQPHPFVVEDAASDDRFSDNPLVTGVPHLRFYAGQPIEAPGGARVGALCLLDTRPRELSVAERSLLLDLAGWVEKELAVDDEMRRAAKVQRGLLPTGRPGVPGYDVAGACVPAGYVGGDFYDWFHAADGLAVTVADVMGKGMGAALLGATIRAVLRGSSWRPPLPTDVDSDRRRRPGPTDGFAAASAMLDEDLAGTSCFATAFHAYLHRASGSVRYADAGHGLSVVVRADGSSERPSERGLPLGIGVPPWPEGEVVLQPGDWFVVFSDGLLEQFGEPESAAEADAVFDRIVSIVASASDAASAIAALLREGGRPTDDVTAMVIRREP